MVLFKEKINNLIGQKATPITTKEKLLELIETNPSITREALSQKLDISINTVKEHILKLKRSNKLERIGDNRNGYWKVIK